MARPARSTPFEGKYNGVYTPYPGTLVRLVTRVTFPTDHAARLQEALLDTAHHPEVILARRLTSRVGDTATGPWL